MLNREFYCRGCGYQLHGIPSGPCPECGRPFDWNKRTTYRAADDLDTIAAFSQRRGKRAALFFVVLLSGILPILLISHDFFLTDVVCCCSTALCYPLWLIACVVTLLSCISTTGRLGLLGCLMIGCPAAVLFAIPAGPLGLYLACPAGLMGGLVFKHLELNNFI